MNVRRYRSLTAAALFFWPAMQLVLWLGATQTVSFSLLADGFREASDAWRQADAAARFWWTALGFWQLMLVPLALMVHRTLVRTGTPYLPIATVAGILAGLLGMIGAWFGPLFLAPFNDAMQASPGISVRGVEPLLLSLHGYLKVLIGQTGLFLAGCWLVLSGFAMVRTARYRPRIGAWWITSGLCLWVGLLQGLGWEAAGGVRRFGFYLGLAGIAYAGTFVKRDKTEEI